MGHNLGFAEFQASVADFLVQPRCNLCGDEQGGLRPVNALEKRPQVARFGLLIDDGRVAKVGRSLEQ